MIEEKEEIKTQLFLQSNEELEKEFMEYKANKLLGKVACDLTDCVDDETVLEKMKQAKDIGVAEILIRPNMIKKGKIFNKDLGLNLSCAVCYPYGDELPSVEKYAVKSVNNLKVGDVVVPCSSTLINEGKFDLIKSLFKKFLKMNKFSKVKVLIDLDEIIEGKQINALKALSSAGVSNFIIKFSGKIDELKKDRIKAVKSVLPSDADICVKIGDEEGEEVVELFPLIDNLIVKDVENIASLIKRQLKY